MYETQTSFEFPIHLIADSLEVILLSNILFSLSSHTLLYVKRLQQNINSKNDEHWSLGLTHSGTD